MRSFDHIAPSLRLFSGPDSIGVLKRELERLDCSRAVIFCGASLWRASSPIALIQSVLGDKCAGVFSGVTAHSPIPSVQAGTEFLRRVDADSVIAVGGGSAIVTARAASILLAENGDPANLSTSQDENGVLRSPKLLAPKLPQLIIPTTPTTAIVKAGSAVFAPDTKQRLALFDPKTRAHAIFIHPDLIGSAPASLLMSASLNTFAMAVEGLMSQTGDPISDALLIHALRLLAVHLPNQSKHGDPDVRSDLIVAAMLCGQGTDYTGSGITTVLGHAIGARFGVENGLANAIVLPHALRFNAEATKIGLSKVATALNFGLWQDDTVPEAVAKTAEVIFQTLNLPQKLRQVGVPRDALPGIAASAMGDWFLRGNPRRIRDVSELQEVLENAW